MSYSGVDPLAVRAYKTLCWLPIGHSDLFPFALQDHAMASVMQASISSLEGTLHDEQRSISDLRSALHLAKSAAGGMPSEVAALTRDTMLKDEV
jgi:hypothetical protein